MTFATTRHALVLGAAAFLLDAVHAHGYCSRPAVRFPNDVDTTQFVATIEATASGLPGSFTGSPADNAAAFWTAFKASKYASLKAFATSLGQVVVPGATIECGLTDPNESPQPVPDEIEWSHSASEGFTPSHEGPCEAWCDDTQVFQDDNCAAHFTSVPATMPYDKAKCSGASRFTFYWLALHSSTWQVYVNCAALAGGSGNSPTQSDAYASESTEQSDQLTPPTNSTGNLPPSTTPTALTNETANATATPDPSYSFGGPNGLSPATPVPETTNESTAPSTPSVAPNGTPPADPSTTPASPAQSYSFGGPNGSPSTSEVVPTNSSPVPETTNGSSADPSTAPVAPNGTPSAGPSTTPAPPGQSYSFEGPNSQPSTSEVVVANTATTSEQPNTPPATPATPTTEVNSPPTLNASLSTNDSVVQDSIPVGVAGSEEEDCGSLDLAGSDGNEAADPTAPATEEDCGSLDVAGSEEEDCGSLDMAGDGPEGVDSIASKTSTGLANVTAPAGENTSAISESSLNFDDISRDYTGGKVQVPLQK